MRLTPFSLYNLTLLWVMAQLRGHRTTLRTVGAVVSISLVLEMVLIVMQVVRGTTSHFNVGTAFDRAVYATMGIAIATMVVAVLVVRQRTDDLALAAALRLGLTGALLGMLAGVAMTTANGSAASPAGAHTVGALDRAYRAAGLAAARGQSVVAPDLATMAAVAVLAVATAVSVRWSLRGNPRPIGLTAG